jgi:AraC-like DNA-binding protein/mannose-6-phosphate isomerase-like protein (cupin superfamily)
VASTLRTPHRLGDLQIMREPQQHPALDLLPRKYHETYEGKTQLLREMPILGRMHILDAIPNSLRPDTHPGEYEIHYVVDGSLGFWVEDRSYDVRAGMGFITQPGVLHGGVHATLQPAEWYWLRARFPSGDRTLPELSRASTQWLRHELAGLKVPLFMASLRLRNCFLGLLEEHRHRTPHSLLMSRLLLHELLVTLIRDHGESSLSARTHAQSVSPPVQRVLRWVQEHLTEELPCIDDVAAIAEMSESHFRRRFHEETGFSPIEYVTHQRIERAKQLLLTSDRSITSLALMLGFHTSAYFAQVFRKLTGMTPSQYRVTQGATRSSPPRSDAD